MAKSQKSTPAQRKIYQKFLETGEVPANPRTLQRLVNAMSRITQERVTQLKAEKISSVALGRLESSKFYQNRKKVVIPRNADAKQLLSATIELRHQLQHYDYFLQAKSSTVEGSREINRQQDIRLFGVDKNGNPLGTLTDDERRAVWSAYENFTDMYRTQIQAFYRPVRGNDGVIREDSLIQQEIARRVKEGGELGISDLIDIYNNLVPMTNIPAQERIGGETAMYRLEDADDGILQDNSGFRNKFRI